MQNINMLMIGIIISLIAYYLTLKWGNQLLEKNEIELPKFTRWLLLNTFAFIISSIVALPFPSIL